MRWAEVRKFSKKIVVRTNFISGDLSVGENAKEDVGDVVVERATVVGEPRGPFGVVVQNVGQQFCCRLFCCFGCVAARVFQRVGEDRDEARVIRWLGGEVGIVVVAGKKGSLIGAGAAIRLYPGARTICGNQCAGPYANGFRPKLRVGTSSTMLQISLSAKKSPVVNWKLLSTVEEVFV